MLILSLGLSSYKGLLFRCPDPSRPRACRAEGRRCWGPCLRRCPTAGSRASRGRGGETLPSYDRLQAAGQGRLWKRDKMQLPGRVGGEERKSSI